MAANFLDITAANVVTWLGMLVTLTAFWVKLKEKVVNLENSQNEGKKDSKERFDHIDRVIEEVKSQGSPSSRTAITVLNSRVDSQNFRLSRVEDAVMKFVEIQADIKWISEWVRKQISKE
jgi:hypothetical protein